MLRIADYKSEIKRCGVGCSADPALNLTGSFLARCPPAVLQEQGRSGSSPAYCRRRRRIVVGLLICRVLISQVSSKAAKLILNLTGAAVTLRVVFRTRTANLQRFRFIVALTSAPSEVRALVHLYIFVPAALKLPAGSMKCCTIVSFWSSQVMFTSSAARFEPLMSCTAISPIQ